MAIIPMPSPGFELKIVGAQVVTDSGVIQLEIGISEGKVQALEPELTSRARRTINATGRHIFPGVIDSHVHFNEPGRTRWEGMASGSRALAAGGGTLFFDMPLNSDPPTTDAEAFDRKVAAARASSVVDFGLWGGLVPGKLDHFQELAERGVVGFKAFMSNSGIEEFPRADDHTLREGMKRAARLRRLVAVHAESESMTSELTQRSLAVGKTAVRDYLDSRPIEAELEAITKALDLAGDTGCALHIVHVTCGAGIALIASAKKLGVDVTCETCPHYLVLTEDDVVQLGAVAKCAPPLRPRQAQEPLWQYVQSGDVFTVGSDHSPSPPEMKTDANFFKVWGGITGVQHTLPILLSEGHSKRGLDLSRIAHLLAFNPAARFGLPAGMGHVRVGQEANLAVVDLERAFKVERSLLLQRHPQSPYIGRALTGMVVRTMLRGQTVFENGSIVGEAKGRLVKPTSHNS